VYWQHGSQFDYPRGPAFVEPAYRWSGDKTWRHVAWQWDETSDEVSVYMDGAEVYRKAWGAPVRDMFCGQSSSSKIVTVQRSKPPPLPRYRSH
jgi:hypothetical protein